MVLGMIFDSIRMFRVSIVENRLSYWLLNIIVVCVLVVVVFMVCVMVLRVRIEVSGWLIFVFRFVR